MTDSQPTHAGHTSWFKTAGVPIAVVGAIAIQAAVLGMWASNLSTRVGYLERENQSTQNIEREITEIRTKQDAMVDDVRAIKQWLLSRQSQRRPNRQN